MVQTFKELIKNKNITIVIEGNEVKVIDKSNNDVIDLGTAIDLNIDFKEIRDVYKLSKYCKEEYEAQVKIAEWIFNRRNEDKETDLILESEVII